jgi:hypothetical protein
MVEVVNATPEADGSRRRYCLRVPPTTRRATEALAWTFRRSRADAVRPLTARGGRGSLGASGFLGWRSWWGRRWDSDWWSSGLC